MTPPSSRSTPARQRARVVLPEPDGPSSTRKRPGRMIEVDTVEAACPAVVLDGAADFDVMARRRDRPRRDAWRHVVDPMRRQPAGASSRKNLQTSATTTSAPSTATTSIAVPPREVVVRERLGDRHRDRVAARVDRAAATSAARAASRRRRATRRRAAAARAPGARCVARRRAPAAVHPPCLGERLLDLADAAEQDSRGRRQRGGDVADHEQGRWSRRAECRTG